MREEVKKKEHCMQRKLCKSPHVGKGTEENQYEVSVVSKVLCATGELQKELN